MNIEIHLDVGTITLDSLDYIIQGINDIRLNFNDRFYINWINTEISDFTVTGYIKIASILQETRLKILCETTKLVERVLPYRFTAGQVQQISMCQSPRSRRDRVNGDRRFVRYVPYNESSQSTRLEQKKSLHITLKPTAQPPVTQPPVAQPPVGQPSYDANNILAALTLLTQIPQ